MDAVTDAAVQRCLREAVESDASLLTIAHRLATVADYDKVMLLQSGKLMEFGSPKELLSKPSRFGELLESALADEKRGYEASNESL